MKKISPSENEKLLNYLDGSLPAHERAQVEEAINRSAELRNRLDELAQVHQMMKTTSLLEPSRNFTQSVMARLDQAPARTGLSTRNSILLLAGVLISVGIGALLVSLGVFDSGTNIELQDVVIKNQFIDVNKSLPAIPFNGKLVVNIIILLNLALAFIVLDRAILRPWFEKRARMHY